MIKLVNSILKSMTLYRDTIILPPETFEVDGIIELPANIEIEGS